MYSKEKRYLNLFHEFKSFSFDDKTLLNPHHISGAQFNYDVINPWELWHGNLDAEIFFIGQDFSDDNYFIKNFKDDKWELEAKSPTNKSLAELFSLLKYDIGMPNVGSNFRTKLPLFFSNAILGIKQSDTKNMSLRVKESWSRQSQFFLKRLIDIVNPKYIIAMGSTAYKAICDIFQMPVQKMDVAIGKNGGIRTSNSTEIFVVAHCSGLGKVNRNFDTQKGDWSKIHDHILQHSK